ncbi:rod shape-determining protein MreC [Halalkalibacillus halophilus]|uniref:rod shape-determining protein MreC n=1 Tax=Halalkalibacillus halophilus TaxID=392827 RepID=UPI0003F97448|nr:rod shape-determining protein MreC [Halalkalibacillus halophilus]
MPGFLRKRKLIVFLASIILVVALIGYSIRGGGQSSLPAQFTLDTVGFFQNLIHTPFNAIVEVVGDIQDVRNIYDQNQVLKEELQDYKTLAYQVNELQNENEDLRSLTELSESISDYESINGTVIARSPERWFEQVTINRGSQHGVSQDMAVTTGDGLIGRVIETSQLTSTVQLLSGFDVDNRISVVVEGNDSVFGLIEGYQSEEEQLIFRELTNEDQLEEGQTVVSSGMGGVFPKGLLIGEVTSVELDAYGLTTIGYVEPAADLMNISNVTVIDRDLFSPSIDEEEE